jgi:hypothetical protein
MWCIVLRSGSNGAEINSGTCIRWGEMTAKTDEQKRIEKLEQSLRIIRTWAVCDHWSQEPRDKAMRDIRDKCDSALK